MKSHQMCPCRLSEAVLHDSATATTATLLLLFGQASTFHTVAYTESLFGALTLAGLCCLYCFSEDQCIRYSPVRVIIIILYMFLLTLSMIPTGRNVHLFWLPVLALFLQAPLDQTVRMAFELFAPYLCAI